jgi:hypothetical protein
MKIFEGPKYQISCFCMNADGFTIFGCLFVEKIKFLLAYMKALSYAENPSSNPLQENCSGFEVAVT